MWGKIEEAAYDLVKRHPALKALLRNIYQLIFSLFAKRGFESGYEIVIRDRAFFGFHDKSPWSPNHKYLLAHSHLGVGNEPCNSIESVEICIYGGSRWLERECIAQTKAFNWQQGAQLQWLSDEEIVFNDFVNDKCVSRVIDIHGSERAVLPFPIGALNSHARIGASFCFKSFGDAMPGYGYNFLNGLRHSTVPPHSLILFDIDSGRPVITLTRSEISSHSTLASTSSDYFVSHAQFSSDAAILAFMIRSASEGKRLDSQLLLLDVATGKVSATPFRGIVSHYAFIGDDSILAYATFEKAEDFFVFNMATGNVRPVAHLLGERDGHPSSSRSGSVVYDTYPDRARRQSLFLWQGGEEKATCIAKLHSPFRFREEYRVDLHPRIRDDGRAICFDTSVTGRRSMATITLE